MEYMPKDVVLSFQCAGGSCRLLLIQLSVKVACTEASKVACRGGQHARSAPAGLAALAQATAQERPAGMGHPKPFKSSSWPKSSTCGYFCCALLSSAAEARC